MTTFVQKRILMWREEGDLKPERRRSESRLKTYPSSTDIRNWCDTVEDRRQHILELVYKGFEKGCGKLVPVEAIIDTLLAMDNAEIANLKKSVAELMDFIEGLNLKGDDLKKFQEMTAKSDKHSLSKREELKTLSGRKELKTEVIDDGVTMRTQEITISCLGADSDSDVNKEENPRITNKIRCSGKMVARLKGLPPGYEVVTDSGKPGRITIKAAGPPTSQSNSSQSKKESHTESTNRHQEIDTSGKESTNRHLESTNRHLESTNRHLESTNRHLESTNGHQEIDTSGKESTYPDKLAATEALCNAQQAKLEELAKERYELKQKLEACLKELDNFKKLQTVANPTLPASCQQEIEALEAEINIMRSGSPSPEEEADIIKKEVEILKRYCTKLKDVESENEKLKVELGSRVAIKDSSPNMECKKMETLKDKLKHLEELTNERDMLVDRVNQLEKQLMQYEGIPEDIEVLKTRSDMLDGALQERDNMYKKVSQIKGLEEELQKFKKKAERVDELERELRNMSKGDRSSGIELRKTQSIAGSLEKELQNLRYEKDAMEKRIQSLKKELETQKAKATEAEMLRLERDRLQIKLNELADIQSQYEEMMNKIKIFDNIKAERDMYKQKYEEVLDMECRCEMLKAQVDEARTMSREKDHLQKQVQDLETCICEQEEEIKGLVMQVQNISKTKDTARNQANSMKEELNKKDRLIAASQEQLTQTQTMATRIKELEKLLHNAEHKILKKDSHIACLENQLSCQTGSLNVGKKLNRKELDAVKGMSKQLEAAKAENKRLQEVLNKMVSISGDDHMKKILKQSECAVKRVVEELSQQYKEWEHIKTKNPKGKFATSNNHDCLCHSPGEDVSSGDDCEKLRHELEDLQKEKHKLELAVKYMQGQGISAEDSKCPCERSYL